jgi:hypothetical protein
MNSKRLAEVLALVGSADFASWWKELEQARTENEAAKREWDELLSHVALVESQAEIIQKDAIDTLYRADESEDAAAKAQAEAAELENKSFRAVSEFEQQRFRASESWYRAGASEKELEERRENCRKAPSRKLEGELHALERSHRHLSDQYLREMQRRDRFWEEVEVLWAKSAQVNLMVAEQQVLAKKVRCHAERLFASADDKRKEALALRGKAERAADQVSAAAKKIADSLSSAKQRFGCGVGKDFLYFLEAGNPKGAYCVSLIGDHENYNLELQPLCVYSLDAQLGVSRLEPAHEGVASGPNSSPRLQAAANPPADGEPKTQVA